MSDLRDQLERERRKFALGDDAMERLERLRDRRRRRRQVATVALALMIAVGGTGGAFLAFRGSSRTAQPVVTPTRAPIPLTATAILPEPTSALQFVDALHGWAVWRGHIYATSNGGKSWEAQRTGLIPIQGVQFIDPLNGWGLTGGSPSRATFETSDGGAHWFLKETEGTDLLGELTSVEFITPKLGWAIVTAGGTSRIGELARSPDGGFGWPRVKTPVPVESFCFVDSKHGYAANGTTIIQTSNGGKSWSTHKLPIAGGGFETIIRCGAEKEAWVLLTDGLAAGHAAYVVLHSADGTRWQSVLHEAMTEQGLPGLAGEDPYPGPITILGPRSLAFVGWCPYCGDGGAATLNVTTDGGTTWQRSAVTAALRGTTPQAVSIIDPLHGWILSESPELAQVFSTSDGGRAWTASCTTRPATCFHIRGTA